MKKVCTSVKFPVNKHEEDPQMVLECVDECKNTLRKIDGFWKEKGMSVAAPQIGYDLRLFIVCLQKNWHTPKMYKAFQTFINPEITAFSQEMQVAWEGCIS